MESFWFFLIVGVIIAIIVKVYTSYENKVKSVIDRFREETNKFYNMAEGYFDVKTNGLKVGSANITYDSTNKCVKFTFD